MKLLTDKITDFCIYSHRYFAMEIWPKNQKTIKFEINGKLVCPCYHSEHHIIGVTNAAKVIISAIGENIDPFGIKNELKNWNQKNKVNITIDQFAEILQIAFAAHDLGNITKTSNVNIVENKPQLDYADTFQLEVGPSEQRSAKLALKLMDFFDTNNEIKLKIKNLIYHLIMQTVFHPQQVSSKNTFWLFIQTIDQIGTHYFSKINHNQSTAGYLNEICVSAKNTERAPLSLNQFLNFLPDRFGKLIPDYKKRRQTLEIFDPQKKFDYLMQPISAPEMPIVYTTHIKEIYEGKYLKSN